ncbi:MAG: hypothetical protein IJW13_00645 [Clostridia bacterium]|nr:hypothetical protein [Clostridia bacterium]
MANKKSKKVTVQQRKRWFNVVKKIIKFRYKEPKFIFLGEKFTTGSIILSNHEGTDAPLTLEYYSNVPIRMWGAHEMNSGLVPLYKYQTKIYYHEKKHWNLFLARLFCLIASPLTNMFYKGLNLISTYKDARFIKTIRESVNAISNGESIVIFPEVSDKGYLPVLEGFYGGFALLAQTCHKHGLNVPIYVSYFNKKKKIYVVDKPVYWNDLIKTGKSKEEICLQLLNRCNELGQMTFENDTKNARCDEQLIKKAS